MLLESVIASDLVLGISVLIGFIALFCMAFATFFWGSDA
jgi:hypothetical protein